MNSAFVPCLNTITIKPASLQDKIRIAGEAGYRAIELWSDDLDAHENTGRSLTEVAGWLQDAGLEVASTIALFNWMDSKEDDDKQAAFAAARSRMEQAASIGSRYIVASPVPDSDELDLMRAAGRYRELLEIGEEVGVIPAVEFLGFFHNVYLLEQAVQIAQAAQHVNACIVLDPFHLYRGGSGFSKLDELPVNMVAICHFNDAPASPPQAEQMDEHRIFPGDGILPLAGMLRTLQKGSYQGALSLELFNPAYWQQDPEQVARTGLAKMQAVMEAAGLENGG